MNEVYEFLKSCGVYYLATDEDGQPRVRPFGTVDLFDGGLYIQTGKGKAVTRQMAANPKVELCAMSADGRWLRVTAQAVLDERIEAQAHLLDAYPSLQAMYQPGNGNTQVYRLENGEARFCSFTAPERVVKF